MRVPWAAVASLLLAVPLAEAQAGPAYQPVQAPDWEPYVQREELGAAGSLEGARRVLRFVQVSDAHILDDDAPFPLRQEPLDDYIGLYSTSAQRPQEEYTDEVLDAAIQAINRQHASDPLQFVVNTGDNIDNALENELMRFLDAYEGTSTTVGPVSGFACEPDGQSESVGDPSTDVTAACTSLPPALVGRMTGLADGLPWLSAFGNHDAMVQGNVNLEPSFQEIAAEFGRYFLRQDEVVAMHFADSKACTASGSPAGSVEDDFGHGYGLAGGRLCDADPDNDGYYAFSAGPVRFIVLDTLNDDFVNGNENLQGFFDPQSTLGADVIGGLAEGAVDPVQVAWMDAEIAAHPDRLVVLFSHHTVNSMFTNRADGQCAPGVGCLADLVQQAGYLTGDQLVQRLSAHPNVVAWIGGHTHRNLVQPKGIAGAGFWNIESASLIDWPQEARTIELWVTADGAKAFWRLTTFSHDHGVSKDLAKADDQLDPLGEGAPADRDVLLWFDVPAGLALPPLPETARQWVAQVDRATPQGLVGSPLPVAVLVRDQLHPTARAPDGMAATWGVVHTSEGGLGPVVTDVAPGTPMDVEHAWCDCDADQHPLGLWLNATFTPTEPGTHYLTVTLLDDGLVVATQVLSLEVAGQTAGTPPRDSPGLAPLALLGALALALAALRRRA